ncbi:MAG: AraC family transcriptional regulator [Niabella sp.]
MHTQKTNSNTVFKYLIINPRDKSFGLTINTVGFETIKPYTAYPLKGHPNAYNFVPNVGRRLNEYQVIYFLDGEGQFRSDSTAKTKIEKGSVLILFPGQWHTYKPSEKIGWDVFYIGFEGPIMENICFNGFFSDEAQILQVGFSEILVELFKRAIEIAKEDSFVSQQRLAGIVMNILTESLFLAQKHSSEKENSNEVIERAKAIMYENYNEDINLESIAVKLCSSYSKFRKIFKKYTGYSPADYFQEIKIRKAKELLLESQLSIKEICYELNFSSYEYFLTRFKKRTGLSPQKFKQQFQKHSL